MKPDIERLERMTPDERSFYLSEWRRIMDEPKSRPQPAWEMTEQRYGDLVDRIHSIEAQYDRLNAVLNMLLGHQAENDSKLQDIISTRHWWKRDPPPPPPVQQPLDLDKLFKLLLNARKEGLL